MSPSTIIFWSIVFSILCIIAIFEILSCKCNFNIILFFKRLHRKERKRSIITDKEFHNIIKNLK